MVFFQYWVTFFSTIFIIYFYIFNFLQYGTSDWFIIQYLNNFNLQNKSSINTTTITNYVFIFGVFLKLGLAPFHLYKIEVYKGIPYITIFFYTMFYFTVLFIFFIFLIFDLLYVFLNSIYNLLFFVVFFGSVLIIINMFDVVFLKAFFAYSTIINSLGFLIIIMSSI